MASQRLLGIDFGEQRIGLAVSEGSLAVPLTIVAHQSRESDLNRIAEAAREQQATTVVIGLPRLTSGDEGEQARRCRNFGDALARRLDVPVVYHDETLTTVDARTSVAVAEGQTASRRKQRVDDVAAAIILQSYIDQHGAAA